MAQANSNMKVNARMHIERTSTKNSALDHYLGSSNTHSKKKQKETAKKKKNTSKAVRNLQ